MTDWRAEAERVLVQAAVDWLPAQTEHAVNGTEFYRRGAESILAFAERYAAEKVREVISALAPAPHRHFFSWVSGNTRDTRPSDYVTCACGETYAAIRARGEGA